MTVQSVLILCVTLPIMIQVFRVIRSLESSLRNFYQYSEKSLNDPQSEDYNPSEPVRIDFWFHIRTSIIDECNPDDVSAAGLKKSLGKMLKESINADIRNTGKVVETISVPDFTRLTGLYREIFSTKASFDEDLDQVACCYRPVGKYCCPKYYYDYTYFALKVDQLEDKVYEILNSVETNEEDLTKAAIKIREETWRGSSYCFYATNAIGCTDYLSGNINMHISDKELKCLDKCLCGYCKKYIRDPLDDSEETDTLLTEEVVVAPGKNLSQTDQEPTGIQKSISHVTVEYPINSKGKTQVTAVSLKDQQRNMGPNLYKCTCNTIVDPDDILWYNLGVKVRYSICKRILFFLILLAMFIFLSTPASIIQLLKRATFDKKFTRTNWQKGMPPFLIAFLRDYVGTSLIFICNGIFLWIAGKLGKWNKFGTKSAYHGYIFRISRVYFLINMVIMPGFSLSGGTTIYDLITYSHADFRSLVESFHLMDNGSFFVNLIFQGVGFAFLDSCLRLKDLIRLGGGSFETATYMREVLDQKKWLQWETHLLPYGKNLAYFSTIITMCCLFGYQAPFILIPSIFFLIFRNLSDAHLMVCVNKKETEEFGTLLSMTLASIMTGVALGHFVVMMLSYFHKDYYAFGINLTVFLIALWLAAAVWFRLEKIKNLEFLKGKGDSAVDGQDLDEWSESERMRWAQLYSHPLLRHNIEVVQATRKVPKMNGYML
jgi:hypothetical protein